MKRIFLKIVMGWTLLLIAGCANTIYKAELDVFNSNNEKQKSILYWSKTGKLIGDSMAGPVILMTACSTRRINFVEMDSGIVFRGNPNEDRMPGQSSSNVAEGTLCGQIDSANQISKLKSGSLLLTIKCEAVLDEFSATDYKYTPAYIQANELPYHYDVQESTSWSILGAIPEVPSPPECN